MNDERDSLILAHQIATTCLETDGDSTWIDESAVEKLIASQTRVNYHDVTDYFNRTDELKSDLAALRSALAQAEAALQMIDPFVYDKEQNYDFCAWCGAGRKIGHSGNCKYPTALAAIAAATATEKG